MRRVCAPDATVHTETYCYFCLLQVLLPGPARLSDRKQRCGPCVARHVLNEIFRPNLHGHRGLQHYALPRVAPSLAALTR